MHSVAAVLLDEDELLDDDVLELELEELVVVVVSLVEPVLSDPPQPASSADMPAPPIQVSALRRAMTCLAMVSRSKANPRS